MLIGVNISIKNVRDVQNNANTNYNKYYNLKKSLYYRK